MADLHVKVGLIGKLDMLQFKNMGKNREKAIQGAPAKFQRQPPPPTAFALVR